MPKRYALYYVPKDNSLIGIIGGKILGRKPFKGDILKRPALSKITEESLIKLTKKASHYGLHATIVAPFAINTNEEAFILFLKNLTKKITPIKMPHLFVQAINENFTALIPENMPQELFDLEKLLVTSLKNYRSKEEVLKDRGPLTERQKNYYQNFGYPFVLEEYRFHITLGDTGEKSFVQELEKLFPKRALEPFTIDSLCLSVEETPDSPFKVIEEFKLNSK